MERAKPTSHTGCPGEVEGGFVSGAACQ
jgi:hypothetical protein